MPVLVWAVGALAIATATVVIFGGFAARGAERRAVCAVVAAFRAFCCKRRTERTVVDTTRLLAVGARMAVLTVWSTLVYDAANGELERSVAHTIETCHWLRVHAVHNNTAAAEAAADYTGRRVELPGLVLFADSHRAMCATRDGHTLTIEFATGRQTIRKLDGIVTMRALYAGRPGEYVALGYTDHALALVSVDTGRQLSIHASSGCDGRARIRSHEPLPSESPPSVVFGSLYRTVEHVQTALPRAVYDARLDEWRYEQTTPVYRAEVRESTPIVARLSRRWSDASGAEIRVTSSFVQRYGRTALHYVDHSNYEAPQTALLVDGASDDAIVAELRDGPLRGQEVGVVRIVVHYCTSASPVVFA